MAEFDLNRQIKNLMDTPSGKKLSEKQGDLQKMADSPDGVKVKEMLNSSVNMEEALKSGNMDALKAALGKVLQTEEGQRLAKNLSSMMK